MSILSLRTFIQKRRWLLIAIFTLLLVGILGVYATSGSKLPSNASSKTDYDSQIANYQTAIDSARTTYKAKPTDYSSISALAELLYKQGGIYAQAASQANTDKDTKKTTAYTTKAVPVYLEAAKLFGEAYTNAPAALNSTGKAQLLIQAADCYATGGNATEAQKKYLAAIKIDSTNYNATMSYTQFLVNQGRYEDAQQLLQVYEALLPSDSTYITNIDSALTTLKQLISEKGKVATPSSSATDKTATDKTTTDGAATK